MPLRTKVKTKTHSLITTVLSAIVFIGSLGIFAFAVLPVFSQDISSFSNKKTSTSLVLAEARGVILPVIGPFSSQGANVQYAQAIDGNRASEENPFFNVNFNNTVSAQQGPLSNGGTNIPCLDYAPLAQADINQIVQFFIHADFECYRHTWTFDQNFSSQVFSSENVRNIALEIRNRLREHPNQTTEIEGLANFLHIAYYLQHGQRNEPINLNFLLQERDTINAVKKAMRSIAENKNFFQIQTETHARTLYAWSAVSDMIGIADNFTGQYNRIFDQFLLSREQKQSYYFNNLISALLVSYRRNLTMINPDTLEIFLRFHLLNTEDFSADYEAFLPQFLFQTLSMIVKLYDDSNRLDVPIQHIIQKMYVETEKKSLAWVSFLNVLEKFEERDYCTLVNLRAQCFTRAIPEIKRQLFPYTYEYDNGTLVVHTALPQSKIDLLYFSAHEVHSGFDRMTQTIFPVENDNAGVLNVYIYGSRKEYMNYQYFLFEIGSVFNGGIYIEQNAEFFTYDRTPQESIYTLEELFRHEYSHYLVGRFLIPGIWGQTPLYEYNRLVWFDEGMAEFLAGSTGKSGLSSPRRVLVEQIVQDQAFLNISDIVRSSYNGNFDFYRYSGLFFQYLYENRFDLFDEIIQTVRRGNPQTYDALLERLSHDEPLNTAYHNYLRGLIGRLNVQSGPDALKNPLTAEVSLQHLSSDIKSIQIDLQKRTQKPFGCSLSAEKIIARFTCRYQYTSILGASKEQAWRQIQSTLNQITLNAQSSPIENLHHIVCRMGPFQSVVSPQGSYYLSTIFCDGPLAGNPTSPGTFIQRIRNSIQQLNDGRDVRCVSEGGPRARCELNLTTYPLQDRTQINRMLEEKKTLLVAQVYADHPSLHKNISCSFQQPVRYVLEPNTGEEYGVQNLVCRWR